MTDIDIYERIRLYELQVNDLNTAINDYTELITQCRKGINVVPPPPSIPPPPLGYDAITQDYATNLINTARQDIPEIVTRIQNLIQKNDVKDAHLNTLVSSLASQWIPRFEQAVVRQYEDDQQNERVTRMAIALGDFQELLDQIEETNNNGKLPDNFVRSLESFVNE